jgi:hypothetical protein
MFEKNMLIATITLLSLISGAAYANQETVNQSPLMLASNNSYGGSYGNYGGYGNNARDYGYDSSNSYYSGKSNRQYYSYYKRNKASAGYSYGKTLRSRYQQSNYQQSNYMGNSRTYASRRTFSYPSQGPTHAKGTFIFDPKQLSWAVYSPQGKLVKTGPASGGSNYCGDLHRRCHTPVGSFTVYAKGTAACKSSKFPLEHPGAPMPYCMYFRGGYAIHGSYEVRPYNASHGCIRLYPQDAHWLSQNAIHPGTKVVVRPYA